MKLKEYVRERFEHQGFEDFAVYWDEYKGIEAFAPNGNIWESGQSISNEAHFIMRMCAQYYIFKSFEAMKFDLTDPNVMEDLEDGNIGTPGRIAKVFCGSNLEDDRELGDGRWRKAPRIATFPNENNIKVPITKRIDIISNCSHHGIVFDSLSREDSYALISYIPEDKVIGISKLQKYANWISHRYFLQEDLTRMLYEGISKIAGTENVYVKMKNLVHGCESKRSSLSKDGAFSSEHYGGLFEDSKLREQVDRSS
jgi:GTP cyclohydrolase I